MTSTKNCIDCGRALPPSRTRPALRCDECKLERRRIKQRDRVECIDCHAVFSPPSHTGKPPIRCEACAKVHRRKSSAIRSAAWRAADVERTRKYDREYQARRRLEPEYRARRDEFEMVRKYGINFVDFANILASQGGACAICGGPPNGPGVRFHVDHCHKSSKVRGLLCGKCNTAIGLLDDDPQRAESVAAYLRL